VASLTEAQSPFAAVLGCADSRVPLEILFDKGFGDLFAVRVAGNVASSAQIGSLEYAAAVLETPLLMVLGHTFCGAVQAAREGTDVPGWIPALLQHITEALPPGETDATRAVEANAVHQARVLRAQSPLIDRLIEEGRVGLVAGVFDLANGEVHILETNGLVV
jgi:carbonic anhydrase